MNGIRTNAALALMCVSALTATSVAENPNSSTNNEASSQTQARSAAAETLLRRFSGEWEGRLEMRNEDRASISIVSVSSRFDADENRFECITQGFAFGKPFDNAEMFDLNEQGTPSKYWWTTNYEDKGAKWSWSIGEDGVSIVGNGREHHGSLAKKFERTMRYIDANKYEVEWFTIFPNGDRKNIAKMTLSRMNRGEHADAAQKFEDGSFESWSAMIQTAQAQAADNDD